MNKLVMPLLLALLCLSPVAASASPAGNSAGNAEAGSVERIRAAIDSSQLVPPEYKRNVNVTTAAHKVALGVYRNPDAQPYDCQIDAIVISGRILHALPDTQQVLVAFYDISDPDRYWQVRIPCSMVTAYAAGKLNRQEVIHAADLEIKRSNQLARTYAQLSYRDMIKNLPIVEGPQRDRRAVALVRLRDLERRGIYIGELQRRFLHVEDLARRGDAPATKREMRQLSLEIDAKMPEWQSADRRLKALGPAEIDPNVSSK